ncbi:Tol biopolymer transport system component [Actinoplanes octamycinicus]|uniref:Tol biopolymer transport system component n=1 Tax=Actinoplanes octamycinicus TaxID=135948 RepID=A0A7W7MAE0_9ACTN|nr:hypothetical protein [Actinoplanes octamycinicus]MBB4742831.1 Tol biopolymer transport system component [Actinoplanes octamycinicus]
MTIVLAVMIGAAGPTVIPVSQGGNGFSGIISADGRYVAFTAGEMPFSPADTNGTSDVYVGDLRTRAVRLVSATPTGTAGAGESYDADVSADGRYVSFTSTAPDLVPGDTNGIPDVFVRDVRTGRTVRASVPDRGGQAEGAWWDASRDAEMSADGRWVTFSSSAPNLTADDTNGDDDVFVRDLRAGTTVRATVAATPGDAGGGFVSSISDTGRYVAFLSYADDLVAGDTNEERDVFVRDLRAGTTTRVNVSSSGAQAQGGICCMDDVTISATGRYVAFTTQAGNLVPGDTAGIDLFVRDRLAGTTTRASLTSGGGQLNNDVESPSISADGRYVSFASIADNVVAGDTNDRYDVFVRDRWAGTTTRVSVSSTGEQGNDDSNYGALSRDGRAIVFGSKASNLVPGDTNGSSDVFLYRL